MPNNDNNKSVLQNSSRVTYIRKIAENVKQKIIKKKLIFTYQTHGLSKLNNNFFLI